MKVLTSNAELRAWRKTLPSQSLLGFVPTMGALHAGHISLVNQARKECSQTLVSIFVNPLQFGPKEDLSRYPRPLEADLRLLKEAQVDAVFLPSALELTPTSATTFVHEKSVSAPLCGEFRPGHFEGVTTIVTKLFHLVQPDIAYFGQKDAQQCAVIERMVADLNFPIEIRRGPTVREKNGLALSSRNAYLSAEEREAAALIYRSFQTIEKAIQQGERDIEQLVEIGKKTVLQSPLFTLQYYEIREATTFAPIKEAVTEDALILVAAYLGKTRLIDNWPIHASHSSY
jgi:pantoate--beta-alanine ligase